MLKKVVLQGLTARNRSRCLDQMTGTIGIMVTEYKIRARGNEYRKHAYGNVAEIPLAAVLSLKLN